MKLNIANLKCVEMKVKKTNFEEMYPNEKYIFVHDFCSDKTFNLKIESDLKVVKPTMGDYSLMDYMKLIENAEEIHCIDSSFINMIDVSPLDRNLFFHDVRVLVGGLTPKLSEKWKTISYEEAD